jgi:serine/threonine-protein kinase RsbW
VNSPVGPSAAYRSLELDDDNCGIEAVASFVREIARQAELPRRKVYWLRLAAEEITTNIVQHGYQGPGPIRLTGEIAADEVRLLIEDEAPAFDPLKHDRHAKLAIDPAEREEGGFGLLLALHRLDGFSYSYAAGKNRNTLVMGRTSEDSGA